MKSTRTIVAILVIGYACSSPSNAPQSAKMTIAFGSCNEQDDPQPMWKEILRHEPEVWIWLGDNIYGDSDIMDTLANKYARQSNQPDYRQLTSQAEVIGTWDDHDFGRNDGGSNYPFRQESQQVFLDFFGVSEDDPRRDREGVYAIHKYKLGSKTIKAIMLDSRYHRDSLSRVDGVYQPNTDGGILGEEQWQWLEKELTNSQADLHLIGNGIQVISEEHRFEKWANFPRERQRLIDLITRSQAKGVILLTGDRHIAEVSSLPQDGLPYPLRDITASGLTHSYEKAGDEPNRYRVSPLIGQKNYGLLTISEQNNRVAVELELKGLNDTTFYQAKWLY